MAAITVAAALLLVVAGLQKVVSPRTLVRPIRDGLGVRVPTADVRAAAAFEVMLGVWVVLTLAPVACALAAASYLGFTGFVVRLRLRGGSVSDCGCFGKTPTPATAMHAVITGAYTATLAAAAVVHPASLQHGGAADVLGGAVAALAVALTSYAAMAVLPATTRTGAARA